MNPVGHNADPTLTFASLLERSEVVTVGIDGGGLDDLLGFAAIGRLKNSSRNALELPRDRADQALGPEQKILPAGRWLHFAHAWAHTSVLERRKEIAPKLRDFAADGDLTIVERVGDDVIGVADFVEQIRDAGLLPDKAAIGVDQAGIGAIVDELAEREIDSSPEAGIIVGIPQGWKLMNSIKTVERKLAGGQFTHGGTRLMAWCVGNAKVEPRGNAILVTKQASGFAKIDPLMATFDAAALMAMNPQAGGVGEGIIILGSA